MYHSFCGSCIKKQQKNTQNVLRRERRKVGGRAGLSKGDLSPPTVPPAVRAAPPLPSLPRGVAPAPPAPLLPPPPLRPIGPAGPSSPASLPGPSPSQAALAGAAYVLSDRGCRRKAQKTGGQSACRLFWCFFLKCFAHRAQVVGNKPTHPPPSCLPLRNCDAREIARVFPRKL